MQRKTPGFSAAAAAKQEVLLGRKDSVAMQCQCSALQCAEETATRSYTVENIHSKTKLEMDRTRKIISKLYKASIADMEKGFSGRRH